MALDIAFIIPTYNEAKRIAATVAQFKAVRHVHYEVIVSDNGSTDQTCEFARLAGATVKPLNVDVRSTIGECRNRGAAATAAEILWFIDADVQVLELEAFADEVVQYFRRHPDTVAILPRLGIYQAEATRTDRFWYGYVNLTNVIQNRILKSGAAPGDCMIVRRSAFAKVHGFNSALTTSEDHDLMRRLARLGEVQTFWHRRAEMSPRRVHVDGWPKVLLQWGRNWIKRFIFHQTNDDIWEPRR